MSAIPFIPFNNTIKLEALFDWDGQRVENVHHYIVDETPNVDTCNSLAASYLDWYVANMRGSQPTSVALMSIKCTILETEFSPGIEYVTGLPLVGTNAGASMPNNVTVAVKWLTGLRGRSYRGRTYHIGLTESMVTNNSILTTIVEGLTDAYGELMALAVDVGPAIMGVASRFQGNAPRTTGVITPVINVSVDPVIDSQRRRLPGRGR